MDGNGELKFWGKFKKNFFFFFWGGGGGVSRGWGGQGGCELRSEAFVNIQKKKKFFLGGVGVGGGGGGGGGGVRVDGNGELKLLGKIQKKNIFFFGGGGGGGSGWDVNGEVKLRGGVGRGWGGRGGGVRSGVGLGEVRGSKVWVRWVMLGMGDVNQE